MVEARGRITWKLQLWPWHWFGSCGYAQFMLAHIWNFQSCWTFPSHFKVQLHSMHLPNAISDKNFIRHYPPLENCTYNVINHHEQHSLVGIDEEIDMKIDAKSFLWMLRHIPLAFIHILDIFPHLLARPRSLSFGKASATCFFARSTCLDIRPHSSKNNKLQGFISTINSI